MSDILKTICTTNRSGYENVLELGKEYSIVDIQDGIFEGSYYIKVDIGGNKTATALLYRFDITKEIAQKYVRSHYLDAR